MAQSNALDLSPLVDDDDDGGGWPDPLSDAGAALLLNAASKPVYSLTQIVNQITTSWGGTDTGHTHAWTTSNISFAVLNVAPTNGGGTPSEASGLQVLTAHEKATAELAFRLWDDLIPTTLSETSSPSANITFNYSTATQGDGTYTRAFGFVGSGINDTITAQQVWIDGNWSTNQDSAVGPETYGTITYIHEIGHALGLSHPGTYNAGSGGTITFANSAVYAQDNREYSVMSYFGGYSLSTNTWTQDGTSGSWLYPDTPMVDDIAAIQALYGVDTTTRTGDTTYGFHSTFAAGDPEKAVYDFSVNTHPIFTIWDAGGNDTLDASGYSGPQTIDLIPGDYSSVDGMNGNIGIAFGAIIENAIGGPGNDTIIGNSADNVIRGNGGNDSIDGGAGTDSVVFAGLRAAYTISALSGNGIDVAGPGVHDTLANIEKLVFDDQTVVWSGGQADLTVANLGISNVTPAPGQVETITFEVDNIGFASAGGFHAGIYLSGDTNITTADTLLDGQSFSSLAGGGATSVQMSVTIPSSVAFGGTYYIGVIVDDTHVVIEGNEGNNTSSPVMLLVPSPQFTGGAGADNFAGTPGNDVISGNGGDDGISGGAGDDHLSGGDGNDIIGGNAGNDVITGDNGNDLLGGDDGNDQIDGGAGNDTIWGGNGDDQLHGGTGDDVMVGDAGNDMIYGDDGNDIANGGAGADVMSGGAGDDILGGGADNDTIVGDDGNDSLWGEDGNDSINGGAGNDSVSGGAGDDQLGGGAGDDVVVGDDGNDTMWGEDGNDRMNGGNGNDTMFGGAGDDQIGGGAGNDFIVGGTGNDTMWGESGSDTFQFTAGDGNDLIADFTPGTDHIWLAATNLHSFANVQSHATAGPTGTVITYTGGSITLLGVSPTALGLNDFIFS